MRRGDGGLRQRRDVGTVLPRSRTGARDGRVRDFESIRRDRRFGETSERRLVGSRRSSGFDGDRHDRFRWGGDRWGGRGWDGGRWGGHWYDRHRHFGRHNSLWLSLLAGGTYFSGYYSPYWYSSYWYGPYWYDSYWHYPSLYSRLWYSVLWYPFSHSYYDWYDDPWYGYRDGYYDGGYAAYYGDWYGPSTGITYTSPNSYVFAPVEPPADGTVVEAAPESGAAQQFLDEAIAAFRAGDYKEALRLAQHATVDMPDNGAVYLLVAQAYFATGEYLSAAETLHHAMSMLPEEEWGLFVTNYRDYYGNVGDFTAQLRELETWLAKEPTAPFGYFWLGYSYGYLGYPEYAVGQLDQAIELSQTDELAERLRDVFSAQRK